MAIAKRTRRLTQKELDSILVSLQTRLMVVEGVLAKVMFRTPPEPDPEREPGPGRADGLKAQPLDYHRARVELAVGTPVGYMPDKLKGIRWKGRVIPTPLGAKEMGEQGPLVYVLVNHPGGEQTKAGWTTRGCYPWNLVRLCEAAKCEGHPCV